MTDTTEHQVYIETLASDEVELLTAYNSLSLEKQRGLLVTLKQVFKNKK
ncbi:MAG: hypothetical protein GQ475_00070 [Methylococcaceae bacterium]|nr:hypothetical protein [Methylococcaceae bacterium]